MTKRISILAYTCSDNVGDNAILEAILNEVKEKVGKCEVCVLDFGLKITELSVPEKIFIKTLNPYNIISIAFNILRSDYVILGGGGIIQATSSIYNFIYFVMLGCLVVALGRPLHVRAVGVESVDGVALIWPLSWLMRNASSVSVRDKDSRDRIRKIAGNEVVIEVEKDPAFTRPYYEDRVRPKIVSAIREPYILVAVRSKSSGRKWLTAKGRNSPGNLECQAASLAPLLEAAVEAALLGGGAGQILFVPCQSPRDELFSHYILERFNRLSGKVLAGPINFDELLYLCRHSSGVCSSRYHACIAALRSGVPILAFSNAKIKSLLNKNSFDGGSFLVPEDLELDLNEIRELFERYRHKRIR